MAPYHAVAGRALTNWWPAARLLQVQTVNDIQRC